MLALAVLVLLAACGSDHHVSLWGAGGPPNLMAFAERADLDHQLSLIDAETATLKLRLENELSVELPHGGGPLRIRGYEGEDALLRRTHAVRVATARGVVMAVGPLAADDTTRDQATELVPALVPGEAGDEKGGAYRSGTDLNGDGDLDVVLRSERGALAIWRLSPLGSSRYEVELEALPTRAIEINDDGFIDLAGEVLRDKDDPIAPRFTDVATFDGVRYTNQTPGPAPSTRAWPSRGGPGRATRSGSATRSSARGTPCSRGKKRRRRRARSSTARSCPRVSAPRSIGTSRGSRR